MTRVTPSEIFPSIAARAGDEARATRARAEVARVEREPRGPRAIERAVAGAGRLMRSESRCSSSPATTRSRSSGSWGLCTRWWLGSPGSRRPSGTGCAGCFRQSSPARREAGPGARRGRRVTLTWGPCFRRCSSTYRARRCIAARTDSGGAPLVPTSASPGNQPLGPRRLWYCQIA